VLVKKGKRGTLTLRADGPVISIDLGFSNQWASRYHAYQTEYERAQQQPT
jgi:hypothetical protein